MSHTASDCPNPEQIFAALEGSLDEPQRSQVMSHLDDCRVCRERRKEAGDLRCVAEMLTRYQLSERERERIRQWQAQVNARRAQLGESH
jgi:hypothetical protein